MIGMYQISFSDGKNINYLFCEDDDTVTSGHALMSASWMLDGPK